MWARSSGHSRGAACCKAEPGVPGFLIRNPLHHQGREPLLAAHLQGKYTVWIGDSCEQFPLPLFPNGNGGHAAPVSSTVMQEATPTYHVVLV